MRERGCVLSPGELRSLGKTQPRPRLKSVHHRPRSMPGGVNPRPGGAAGLKQPRSSNRAPGSSEWTQSNSGSGQPQFRGGSSLHRLQVARSEA
jgi:hypothetical protein